MKKGILFYMVLGLFFGRAAFAGNGDLIVNGKVGIGVTNPTGKLNVCDGNACIRWSKVLGNYGHDIYGAYQVIPGYYGDGCVPELDTCDGNAADSFSCPVGLSKNCVDVIVWSDVEWCGYDESCPSHASCDFEGEAKKRNVTCKQEYRMISSSTDGVIAP